MKTEDQIIADEAEKKRLLAQIKSLLDSGVINAFNDLTHQQCVVVKSAASKAQRLIKSSRPKLDELRNVHHDLSKYLIRKE